MATVLPDRQVDQDGPRVVWEEVASRTAPSLWPVFKQANLISVSLVEALRDNSAAEDQALHEGLLGRPPQDFESDEFYRLLGGLAWRRRGQSEPTRRRLQRTLHCGCGASLQ